MPSDPPTIGELTRRLDRLESEMREEMARLRDRSVSLIAYQAERSGDREIVANIKGDLIARIDNFQKDVDKTINGLRDSLVEDIGEIKESNKWAFRTGVAAFLLPIIVGIALFVLLGRA